MLGARQGIIVYLHTLKQAKMLRKFGNIHYVSKKLKYVVLYTNMDEVEPLVEKLNNYSFVKKWTFLTSLFEGGIRKLQAG